MILLDLNVILYAIVENDTLVVYIMFLYIICSGFYSNIFFFYLDSFKNDHNFYIPYNRVNLHIFQDAIISTLIINPIINVH